MVKPFSEEIRQQWKDNILKQRQSKLTIASWCRQKEIAVHAFYYWEKKLFPKSALDRSAFTEAIEEKHKSSTGIVLEYQGFNIHLNDQFNSSVLKRCLEVLRQC
jgi:diketogulonate reductase-like aldo/keto reductase